jgi:hypothetical protein
MAGLRVVDHRGAGVPPLAKLSDCRLSTQDRRLAELAAEQGLSWAWKRPGCAGLDGRTASAPWRLTVQLPWQNAAA